MCHMCICIYVYVLENMCIAVCLYNMHVYMSLSVCIYIKSVYINGLIDLLNLFATHLTVQVTLSDLHQYTVVRIGTMTSPLSFLL